jgi:hypothetical protein
MGTEGFFLRVNRLEREVNHHHLVPGLKIRGIILLLPLYGFMAWIGRTFYFCVTVKKCLPSVGIKILTSKIIRIVLVQFVFLTLVTFTYL